MAENEGPEYPGLKTMLIMNTINFRTGLSLPVFISKVYCTLNCKYGGYTKKAKAGHDVAGGGQQNNVHDQEHSVASCAHKIGLIKLEHSHYFKHYELRMLTGQEVKHVNLQERTLLILFNSILLD